MRLIRPLTLISLCGLIPTLAGCGAAKSAGEPDYAPAGAPDSVAYAADEEAAGAPMAYPGQPMAQAPAGAVAPGQSPAAPPVASPVPQAKRMAAPKEASVAATGKPPQVAVGPAEPQGTEQYTDYGVNPAVDPAKDPLSTFAIDVDTASYSIARSKLTSGQLPPFQSVRAEEFVNYFNYGYAGPSQKPFAVHLHAAPPPWSHSILCSNLIWNMSSFFFATKLMYQKLWGSSSSAVSYIWWSTGMG